MGRSGKDGEVARGPRTRLRSVGGSRALLTADSGDRVVCAGTNS